MKLHPYKIITHQLLIMKAIEKRVQFCKVITDMFENEKQIIFTDEAYFWFNEYINKQELPVLGKRNPNVSIAVPLIEELIAIKNTLETFFYIHLIMYFKVFENSCNSVSIPMDTILKTSIISSCVQANFYPLFIMLFKLLKYYIFFSYV